MFVNVNVFKPCFVSLTTGSHECLCGGALLDLYCYYILDLGVNLLLDPRVLVFLYLYLFGISVASSTLRDTVVVASKSSSASSLSPSSSTSATSTTSTPRPASSQQPWQPLPLLPQYSVSHIVFQLVDVAPKSPAGFGWQQFATWFRWDFSVWRDHGNEDGAFAFLNPVAF